MAKLLIVDDEPFTVEMLETFLQINGFETLGASNGEDGLVLLRIEHPEIIILDLMLPDIEGYEVCRRLRSQPETANIPVLILSARAESASRERAIAAGADVYLTKPVKFPELLVELKRLAIEGHITKLPSPPVVPQAPAVEVAALLPIDPDAILLTTPTPVEKLPDLPTVTPDSVKDNVDNGTKPPSKPDITL